MVFSIDGNEEFYQEDCWVVEENHIFFGQGQWWSLNHSQALSWYSICSAYAKTTRMVMRSMAPITSRVAVLGIWVKGVVFIQQILVIGSWRVLFAVYAMGHSGLESSVRSLLFLFSIRDSKERRVGGVAGC